MSFHPIYDLIRFDRKIKKGQNTTKCAPVLSKGGAAVPAALPLDPPLVKGYHRVQINSLNLSVGAHLCT